MALLTKTEVFKLLMQATLLFSVESVMAVTLPLCMAIVYLIQKVYLRTSQQLRFIELESKAAVYSSVLETVEGITTIRAFQWQQKFAAENTFRLANSQRPSYLRLCLQRLLNIVLDLLIAGIAVGVIALTVYLRGTTTGQRVGIALNMILVANTTLLRLVESWTTMELSIGAIARLKSVKEITPKEDKPWENFCPPKDWPFKGRIDIHDITVSYR